MNIVQIIGRGILQRTPGTKTGVKYDSGGETIAVAQIVTDADPEARAGLQARRNQVGSIRTHGPGGLPAGSLVPLVVHGADAAG